MVGAFHLKSEQPFTCSLQFGIKAQYVCINDKVAANPKFLSLEFFNDLRNNKISNVLISPFLTGY